MVLEIFPLLGLVAFFLLWLHAILGVFEPWLRPRMDFDAFVHWTSLVILVSIILHPLFFLILAKWNFGLIFASWQLILGLAGFLLLITYDIGKALKTRKFFPKRWKYILFLSTLGFILIFFHSLFTGSNLQSGQARILWLFFGATGILATIYTYIIKNPFWK